ncbi:hypothetical protein EDB92DRAFT_2118732 [Lactarius akahatsu]|uniref:Uncharacterized protein n=1 Tax=Lactarius akahatsu TaxID=416441 RepID=A0AAD4L761_9AGAM|nr:hypothetical protein EDB92DRAFT_2118732 [Lactarius akahatsu]
MGKLKHRSPQIVSPVSLDNIERVRRDEEAAKLKQTEDTDRALVADAESRLDALRSRAGITHHTPPPPGDGDAECPAPPVASGSGSSSITLSNGHINLFADLEEHTAALAARASKSKPAVTDADRGVALAPTKQDTQSMVLVVIHPQRKRQRQNGRSAKRDLARQVRADPLASIPSHLMRPSRTTPSLPPPHPDTTHRAAATHSRLSLRLSSRNRPRRPPHVKGAWHVSPAERERALALVRRKQRERAESATATPSTIARRLCRRV